MIVRASPRWGLGWLTARTGVEFSPAARGIEAVSAGRVLAMVVFDQWTRTGVDGHMACDEPMAIRPVARAAWAYIFGEAGRQLIVARIASSNGKSRRLAQWLGFRETHRVLDGWDKGDDAVLMELRKGEQRAF